MDKFISYKVHEKSLNVLLFRFYLEFYFTIVRYCSLHKFYNICTERTLVDRKMDVKI